MLEAGPVALVDRRMESLVMYSDCQTVLAAAGCNMTDNQA